MKKLSIIIPVYYNEKNLAPLYEDMKEKVLLKLSEIGYDYEIVFVNDGSGDGSYAEMEKLAAADERIVNVSLSRNFGSHAAILAGLSVCTGDCATMKAADLQEPSEMILDMLAEYKKGVNVVLAVREGREEGFFQRAFANAYYSVMRRYALKNMPKGGFDCFLIDRKVVDVLCAMEEKNTSLMGQILWCGFSTSTVGYIRQKREIGRSRWTFGKKVKLFMDSLLGFSYAPIRAIFGVGIFCLILSVVWSLVILINRFSGNIPVSGYTTIAIILLCGFGLVLSSLGILGEYIWRMFDATRKRPPYIIEKTSKPSDNKKVR